MTASGSAHGFYRDRTLLTRPGLLVIITALLDSTGNNPRMTQISQMLAKILRHLRHLRITPSDFLLT